MLRFRGIYDEYDADGSGFITFQELKGALEQQRLDKACLCVSCSHARSESHIDPSGTRSPIEHSVQT